MPRKKGSTAWNKGLKNYISEETRKKLSESAKRTKNFTGKKHTEEAKEKMRIKKINTIPINKKFPNDPVKSKQFRSWTKNSRNRKKRAIILQLGSHTFGEWDLLKKQYNYTCPCCKKHEPEIKLTEDHIIPLSKGGSDLIENIQPLCLLCNIKKSTNIIRY